MPSSRVAFARTTMGTSESYAGTGKARRDALLEAEERGRQAERDEAFGTLLNVCNDHLSIFPLKECGICKARHDALREAAEDERWACTCEDWPDTHNGAHMHDCLLWVADWLRAKAEELTEGS